MLDMDGTDFAERENRSRCPMQMPNHLRESLPDHCVLCGEKTEYSTLTPVSDRSGYIEGAGQLCPACFRALYRKGGDRDG